VTLYTLEEAGGMSVAISDYGGVVQAIFVPDREGRPANVALGFASLQAYLADPRPGGSGRPHFGALIGRFANRIAGGAFTLDGERFELPRNNGPNTLHGGPGAWDTQVWTAAERDTPQGPAVELTLTDQAGANGFPGTVEARVLYTLLRGALRIDYAATTDAPTVINLTNHSYFNLAGEGSGSVLGQELMINAERYAPVDENLIPTGELAPLAGTPFDFRSYKPIGRDINDGHHQIVLAHGFDHNFVLEGDCADGPRLAARAFDPPSGRLLSVFTSEPGVQLYSGNNLAGELVGTGGRTYRQGDGFCLETQHFPDSPNQAGFPSTVLRPGETFSSTTIFEFTTVAAGSRPPERGAKG
jgi:aldose 1-epimerase